MNIAQLRLVLEMSPDEKVLDFSTSDGRVFQISGDSRFAGCFERFYCRDSHPTRRNVSEAEVSNHFSRAVSYILYINREGQSVTLAELEAKVKEVFE